MYAVVYSLGASRCIILHLATAESLQHAMGGRDNSLLMYSLIVASVALVMVQVGRPPSARGRPWVSSLHLESACACGTCVLWPHPLPSCCGVQHGCTSTLKGMGMDILGPSMQCAGPTPQVKSLSNLGWFLSIGTFGQLFAGVVVVYKLLAAPWADAVTEVVHTDEASTSLVAVMNIIFA